MLLPLEDNDYTQFDARTWRYIRPTIQKK